MNATPAQTRDRQVRCETLLAQAAVTLEALRDALDMAGRGTASGTEQACLLAQRASRELQELAALTVLPGAVAGLDARWADAASLQAFRREGLAALERLQRRYDELCDGPWLSAGDTLARRAARRLSRRTLLALLAVAVVFGGWWQWQQRRMADQAALLESARANTAQEAVLLIGMAWAQAARVQGVAPAALLEPGDGGCLGADLRGAAPDNPCRQAWNRARARLFAQMVPVPGNTFPPPSEVLLDPWGSPYVLRLDAAGRAQVVSAGPDGRVGTADDVVQLIP